MTTTSEILDHTTSVEIAQSLMTRIAAALSRAKARRDYRQMLAREDHILRDMGVTRYDIRQALMECGGRP
jgi:uncharacterized protein YjiS (DUF1127 family)